MKKVIVVSAHPEDEILGVSGTLLEHQDSNDEIYWLIRTNIFEKQGFTKERIKSRQEEIDLIANKLGIKKVYKLDYPTMTLTDESLIAMIPEVSSIFRECRSETLYCLNRSDAHSDYRVTFNAIMACTKSFRYPYIKKVLMYECISETEFAPSLHEKAFIANYFVDISKYLSEKSQLMKIYKPELGEHSFPRSERNIEDLATYRGAYTGVEYAEAFHLLLNINK